MDAGDDKVHLFENQLLKGGIIPVGVSDYGFGTDDVVTEKMSLQVHHISFAAPKQRNLMPLPGPLVHAKEVLVVLDVFVISIKHIAEMIGAGKELQPRLPGGLNILLQGGIGVP